MVFFSTSYLLLVSNFISLFFFKNKNLFIIKFKKKLSYLSFLNDLLIIVLFKNKIFIIKNHSVNFYLKNNILNAINGKKKLYDFISKFVYEILVKIYKKLNIIGIGFKIFKLVYFSTQILVFKLGFSHSIYLKMQNKMFIVCLKLCKLFLFGNLINDILILAFLIKSFKLIDIYNGKGVFFYNQKVVLKKKRVV